MGQYHLICNLDRLEWLEPLAFGDGRKMMEFAMSGSGAMAAQGLLLMSSNNERWTDVVVEQAEWLAECGVQDWQVREEMIGRWAGDRIAIVGDAHRPEQLRWWGWHKDAGLLQPGGPWGNDKWAWTNVSWLGLVALGLAPPDNLDMQQYVRGLLARDASQDHAPRVPLHSECKADRDAAAEAEELAEAGQ